VDARVPAFMPGGYRGAATAVPSPVGVAAGLGFTAAVFAEEGLEVGLPAFVRSAPRTLTTAVKAPAASMRVRVPTSTARPAPAATYRTSAR